MTDTRWYDRPNTNTEALILASLAEKAVVGLSTRCLTARAGELGGRDLSDGHVFRNAILLARQEKISVASSPCGRAGQREYRWFMSAKQRARYLDSLAHEEGMES